MNLEDYAGFSSPKKGLALADIENADVRSFLESLTPARAERIVRARPTIVRSSPISQVPVSVKVISALIPTATLSGPAQEGEAFPGH